MNHSRAPWTYHRSIDARHADRISDTDGCSVMSNGHIILDADAALMAAAPDLLAALVDLLAACPETYDTRHQRLAAMDAITKAHRSL